MPADSARGGARGAPRGRLLSLNVGTVQRVQAGARTLRTAIGKRPVAGSRAVLPLGIEGDEQANPALHGGLAKAVYAYPHEHYAFWRTVRAQAGLSLWDEEPGFGLIGENLTIDGLLETDCHVGDVLRFPHCELAVSEPRLPCSTLNAALGFAHAVKLMNESAWCGFYLAVRTPGHIAAGETYELVPGPRDVQITELFRARARRPAGSSAG